MAGTFDFCVATRVAEELPPEETSITSMNGWQYSSKPKTPYRPSFKVTLHGLRWYLNAGGNALDLTTNLDKNAGRLLQFYKARRMWDTFTYNHEYLGAITVRFEKPVTIPAALPNSRGLIAPLEIQLVQHNPSWTA